MVSVQVITKQHGQSKLVRTIGSSNDEKVIESLVEKGNQFITSFGGQKTLDFSDESSLLRSAFQSINSHTEIGTELLLGKIFDDVGFHAVDDPIFRQLVLIC